jgi:hypothetical protein
MDGGTGTEVYRTFFLAELQSGSTRAYGPSTLLSPLVLLMRAVLRSAALSSHTRTHSSPARSY